MVKNFKPDKTCLKCLFVTHVSYSKLSRPNGVVDFFTQVDDVPITVYLVPLHTLSSASDVLVRKLSESAVEDMGKVGKSELAF